MWTTLKLDLCCFCYWKWMHVLLRRKGKATITLILTSELKAVMWPVSRREKKADQFPIFRLELWTNAAISPFCYDSGSIICVGVGLDSLGPRCCWMPGAAAVHEWKQQPSAEPRCWCWRSGCSLRLCPVPGLLPDGDVYPNISSARLTSLTSPGQGEDRSGATCHYCPFNLLVLSVLHCPCHHLYYLPGSILGYINDLSWSFYLSNEDSKQAWFQVFPAWCIW